MKEQTSSSPVQIETSPQQVWPALTTSQQQAVWKTIVHICQHLAQQWPQEKKNERETRP